MARAIAERMARQQMMDSAVFDSAGLRAPAGEPPTLEAASFMHGEKISIINHRSKRLTVPLVDGADVILCMTKAQMDEARKAAGPDYAPKFVQINEAVDLTTTRMDVMPPGPNTAGMRRLYAALSATIGRLIRTLEEPDASPEYFGAKTMPKKLRPGAGGAGPRVSETTLDPEKRVFIANMIFSLIERAFEPMTTGALLDQLAAAGHQLPKAELEELLRQDLHGLARMDKDGAWNIIHGAAERKRDKARAEARARAEDQRKAREAEKPKDLDKNLTEDVAFELLGIRKETSRADAQKKYRALLKRYHPDRFHDDPSFLEMAEAKTRRVNAAWEFLKERLPEGEAPPEAEEVQS
ncbi:DnaJ domain-containing protein [Candidatus Sumerlaeota bacterium]|nr:DnaJ domain-containing protein [Candidatus Sumerlaeota bacterium]